MILARRRWYGFFTRRLFNLLQFFVDQLSSRRVLLLNYYYPDEPRQWYFGNRRRLEAIAAAFPLPTLCVPSVSPLELLQCQPMPRKTGQVFYLGIADRVASEIATVQPMPSRAFADALEALDKIGAKEVSDKEV